MTKANASTLNHKVAAFVAIMVGMAVPLRVSGVAVEQAALALALLAALFLMVQHSGVRTLAARALASPQAKIVAAMFVAWAVTIFFSFDPWGSLKIGGRTGLFILASVTVWAALTQHLDAQRLLWKTMIVASLGMAFMASLSLSVEAMNVAVYKVETIDLDRLIYKYKAFGAAAMCLIPAVAWAGRKLGGKWRWAGYVFAPLALAVMVLTFNRSALAGFLAMAIAATLLLAVGKHRHVKGLLATAIAVALGIVAWVRTKEQSTPTIEGDYLPEWLIDPHRQHIWKFAYERFLEHPWVGNGIDQLNRLPGAKMPVKGLAEFAAQVPSHPHNWGLEILSETGLVGFVPTLFALGFIAWQPFKRYLASGDEADLALLSLMAGFWASALFNFSIWASWWQLTFFILFAIFSVGRVYKV